MSLDDGSFKPSAEGGVEPRSEFEAFDALTRILVSVPVHDIRLKLEDVSKNRGDESISPES
jgi:hypothetical protein